MGFLPSGLFRKRDSRPELPMYEQVSTPTTPLTATKEHFSDAEPQSSDEDGDDEDDGFYSSAASSPISSHRGSRQSSGTASTHSLMLPKRAFVALPRKKRSTATALRAHLYRLPNRVIRYMCTGLIMTILLLIVFLVRASLEENRRVGSGTLPKKPPPPPAWESFGFLNRYYGGVRNLVAFKDNVPQYPRQEDEEAFNVTSTDNGSSGNDGAEDVVAPSKAHLHPAAGYSGKEAKTPLPASNPFDKYAGSVFAAKTGAGPVPAQACFLDSKNTVSVPPLRYFDGRPNGFPENVMGSYELLSLPEDICFERFGRYGPYGYGYSVRSGGLGIGEYGEKEGAEAVWGSGNPIDYRTVDWAEVQQRCFQSNAGRFKPTTSRSATPQGFSIGSMGNHHAVARDEAATAAAAAEPSPADVVPAQGDMPRTAVVVRCWDEFVWGQEDIMNLRALITELALASGARYDVHLLVQIKDDAKYPIWADDAIYQQRIKDTVPAEFQSLVTLWTETQMLATYQGIFDLYTRGPGLPVHGVYRGLQMAMQHFAYNHPEYEYFWQWELDIRYTGHMLDLFTKLENWSKEQPRKGLWERNARFYLPSVHGSWDDFRQMARVQSELGVAGTDNVYGVGGGQPKGKGGMGAADKTRAGEQTVWGPMRPTDPNDWFEPEQDPVPPTTYDKDRYVWGVGEEADLITLNPIFDPAGTTWLLADDITGYNETEAGKPPRRAQIITASRMSRRLLRTMHLETAYKKHHAFSEMWPATAALHHGYKAVYVPHPVYVDREWPTQYMARIFNGGRNGATGGSRTAVFGQREHNFLGLTWYYNAGFAGNLYRRWLGLRVNSDGGAQFEQEADLSKDDATVGTMRGGEGRMCLPPMLLHPIKNVELPVESNMEDAYTAPESEANPSS